MPSIISNRFLFNLATKKIDLTTDTLKAAILSNAHVPNKDNNSFADVSINEVSGTGYTAGGKVLTNVSVTQDDAGDKVTVDADDLSWNNVTFVNGRYLVIYDDTLVTKDICFIYDFGADKSPASDDFNVSINALGLFDLTQV